ncbi:hypothetical protein RYZ26_18630 [Terasakiella sp. A23]|uniref:hypothetical protein n=1 Tax=Terasakiella sp. FCG-A23 TaxID=3080561 RepID=UPI0029541BA9|nr:hypothetical protein [Terasakiella sp. A23]MDV7341623.1 hypothetical protein [Terasakiella sp. A23]
MHSFLVKMLSGSFLLCIFLYPFIVEGFHLHVIPQALLLALGFCLLFNRSGDTMPAGVPVLVILMCFILTGMILLGVSRESFADEPNYLLLVKLFVNITSIILCVLFLDIKPETQKRFIELILLVHFCMVMMIYGGKAFTPSWWDLVIKSATGQISSVGRYGLAFDIEQWFGNKNLVGSFWGMLSAYYLYLCVTFKMRVSWFFYIIGLLLALVCFSRAAEVIALVPLLVYFALRFNTRILFYLMFALSIPVALIFINILVQFNDTDGFYTRFLSWVYFFEEAGDFWIVGQGFSLLNESIDLGEGSLSTGNYHVFFMNQIATYGIGFLFLYVLYFILFFSICKKVGAYGRYLLIPLSAYSVNVMVQNYGVEFQVLYPFILIGAVSNFKYLQSAQMRNGLMARNDLAVANRELLVVNTRL